MCCPWRTKGLTGEAPFGGIVHIVPQQSVYLVRINETVVNKKNWLVMFLCWGQSIQIRLLWIATVVVVQLTAVGNMGSRPEQETGHKG